MTTTESDRRTAASFSTLTWDTEPAGELAEIQVGWGEDTKCGVCLTDLPATATAYRDGDSVLCVDCTEAETFDEAEWVARAVRMAAAEIVAEEPLAAEGRDR
jgi:hypothetical protein